MAFTLQAYQQKRPYLFHLTRPENFVRIKQTHHLESAAHLLNLAGQSNSGLHHRPSDLTITLDEYLVVVRDQAPFHAGNVDFTGGWNTDRLIKEINRRVFFWSGSLKGPVGNGRRHFERYQNDNPIVIRSRFDELVQVNPTKLAYFCKYNSGSPRSTNGKRSPRGPETFAPGIECMFTPSDVIEVTFLHRVTLPETAEAALHYDGPWTPMFR